MQDTERRSEDQNRTGNLHQKRESSAKEHILKGDTSGFYDGCEPVSCPNPDCNQDLMDLDEDFWEHGDAVIHCRRCKQPAKHVGSLGARTKPSKTIYMFKCAPCKIKFTRRIPGMKRHCPSCKEEIYMFWNLLLGLPGHSSK